MNDSTNMTTISRAYNKAARWQVIATAFVAIASFAISGVHAAFSAVLGGAIVIVGSYAGVAATAKTRGAEAGGLLLTLLKAEAIKILVIVLLLFATYKFYQGLVPLALISGLASAALIAGAGLRNINN